MLGIEARVLHMLAKSSTDWTTSLVQIVVVTHSDLFNYHKGHYDSHFSNFPPSVSQSQETWVRGDGGVCVLWDMTCRWQLEREGDSDLSLCLDIACCGYPHWHSSWNSISFVILRYLELEPDRTRPWWLGNQGRVVGPWVSALPWGWAYCRN